MEKKRCGAIYVAAVKKGNVMDGIRRFHFSDRTCYMFPGVGEVASSPGSERIVVC